MTDEPSESGPVSDSTGSSETQNQNQDQDQDQDQDAEANTDTNTDVDPAPARTGDPDSELTSDRDRHTDRADGEIPLPFDGPTLVKTGLKASIGPSVLPRLLRQAQRLLGKQVHEFRRQHERVHTDDERAVFLADQDYWTRLGAELEFNERETDAVRRAHRAQLLRIGDKTGRSEEFETALEIRQSVVIAIESE